MSPNTSTATFDLADLLNRLDGDRELLRDLVDIFKQTFPNYLSDLRKSLDAHQAKQLEAACHILKGMLLNLSAPRASALAGQMEILARENQIAAVLILLPEFEAECRLLALQLDACLVQVPS